ncbi:Hybrid signal transduction histidine kinase L [Diplonema papillatum]|nr:Hybrid signal transduction histidine kinase L [Diplonema papillatum]
MRYGLIFMDCHMPVLDGYGAAQKIRDMESKGLLSQGQPPVVIVALTADALPHTRGLCVSAGMNDYITKPLRRATLKGVLDTYYYTDDEQTPPGTTT